MPSINCEAYDYLEIACLYHYQVVLALRNGTSISGKALNVGVVILSDIKQEAMLIEQADGESIWLPTSDLVNMQVDTPESQFTFVSF
ncbi:Rho-binding antiterminator [Paraglaciecola hydrolytica]|uniref:Transcriptional antiterminator n=1 Tax=Paraglaciecola hydrolytica TaxID=1799789 RepID=A0A136A034_9ALTE|nr:Rho-binding antiterminator [Paraglaciecola hydrolytica]KXI28574.1 hypothetical protein AX660_15920 [Paraglaciecola hydrolytica]